MDGLTTGFSRGLSHALSRDEHPAAGAAWGYADVDGLETLRTASRVHLHVLMTGDSGVDVAAHPADPNPGSLFLVSLEPFGAFQSPHRSRRH